MNSTCYDDALVKKITAIAGTSLRTVQSYIFISSLSFLSLRSVFIYHSEHPLSPSFLNPFFLSTFYPSHSPPVRLKKGSFFISLTKRLPCRDFTVLESQMQSTSLHNTIQYRKPRTIPNNMFYTTRLTAPPTTPHIALILHSPQFSHCLLSFLFFFNSMALLPTPPLRNELGRGHSVHNAEEHGQQEAGPGRDFRRGELRPRFQKGSQIWIREKVLDFIPEMDPVP
jgi:hypothetical protein